MDGNIYESSDETLKQTPQISDYTVVFDPKGIKRRKLYTCTFGIYKHKRPSHSWG